MSLRKWIRRPSDLWGHAGWGATAAVVVIGVAISLGVAGALRADVTAQGTLALAGDAELLARTVESDVELVTEQVRGLRGLFEASVIVTAQEFHLFSRIVGFTPSSVLVYAPRIEGPDGAISWPVQHVVAVEGFGPELGADLADSPAQAEAIARAYLSGQSSMSGFISLSGDADPGDVAIFQTVTAGGRVVGLVGGMIQIDERLGRAAAEILAPGQTWRLEEPIGDPAKISTPYEWGRTLEFGRESRLRLTVASDHVMGAATERPLAVLVVGALITGLAAWLVLGSQRRRRTDREIEWLRRSSVDKDRFLAGVGHELRTPLTVVVGMLDLASDLGRELTTHERVELLATARVHAQEIARIVDDFVTAGRLSADALTIRSEPIDLDSLVAKLIVSGSTDSRLEVTAETGLGICLGDGLRIIQIMHNLLDNARRNAHRLVRIAGHVDGQFVTVEVSNDGPAIDTEQGDGLFEPFMAVRPEGQPQPVGLGLSVSRALARRMGGDLVYQWRDGLVVFSLVIPVAPAPLHVVSSAAT
jgi:signal transduction histidine kinase